MSEILKQLPQELRITPSIINVLCGEVTGVISTPSFKGKDDGKEVQVRLAKEGPAMFGLEDWQDNREWAGITNHVLLSARLAVYLAQKLAEKGHEIDIQTVLDAMIVSHAGRRQWDEANWYPGGVVALVGQEEANRRRSVSNEELGLELIKGRVDDKVFKLVAALAHNLQNYQVDQSVLESLEFLVAIYADHRTSQRYEPLHSRMGDFLLGNFFDKDAVDDEKKQTVYRAIEDIINRQKAYKLKEEGATEVSLDEADDIANRLGAKEDSSRLSRKDLMRLILQDAETEALLIQAEINPATINDETVPMPQWEADFRREYIEAAADSIQAKIKEINNISDPTGKEAALDQTFPPITWWGKYVRKHYLEQNQNN